jgi:hypothetical protein
MDREPVRLTAPATAQWVLAHHVTMEAADSPTQTLRTILSEDGVRAAVIHLGQTQWLRRHLPRTDSGAWTATTSRR